MMEKLKVKGKKFKNLLSNKLFIILLFVLSLILMLLPIIFKVQFESFRALGILGIFIMSFLGSATIVLPTPALLAVAYEATIYNPLPLALVAALGSTLGETTTFIFGFSSKKLAHIETEDKIPITPFRFINDILAPTSTVGNKTHRIIKSAFDSYGSYLIPFLAFIPNPLFDGMGLIAGILGYPIKKYLVLTFIGRFARFLLIGFIGQQF